MGDTRPSLALANSPLHFPSMTPSTSLVPAAPQPPAAALAVRPAASPVSSLDRLVVHQRVGMSDRICLVYWLAGDRPSSWGGRKSPRDMATIALFSDSRTFTLSYYPKDSDQIQITGRLDISLLPSAVDDLVAAGFPVSRTLASPPPQSSSPLQPALPPVRRSALLPP